MRRCLPQRRNQQVNSNAVLNGFRKKRLLGGLFFLILNYIVDVALCHLFWKMLAYVLKKV